MELKEESLISVIIPIYNVGLYLNQCLKSVCNQSYKNIEIILIDDGSTDISKEICKTWAFNDRRIRYYKQENIGLGPTRNRGIALAIGKYITFIDADDWVHKNYLKFLYYKLKIEGSDICTGGLYFFDEQNKKFELLIYNLVDNDINNYGVNYPHIPGRLYRIDLFTKYNIKMPSVPYEDLATYPILGMLAKKISYINEPLYYYRINREKSIMNNLNNIMYYPNALSYLISEGGRLNLFNSNKRLLMEITIYHMNIGLSKIQKMYNEQYKQVLSRFKRFIDRQFNDWRDIYSNRFWVFGSYNLSRLTKYLMLGFNICDKDTTYYGFSSIISLMANKFDISGIYHDNTFRLNMLNRDIYKSFRNVKINENDSIIIDFLEERYDIIKINNSYITKSEVLDQSSYIVNDTNIINRDSVECTKLWKDSCLHFIDYLKDKFDLKNIILVEIYLCEKYLTKKGENYYKDNNICRINKILAKYYSFFKDKLRGIKVIKIPQSFNYTDSYFKYGCEPYNLNEMALLKMLQSIL